MTAAEPTLKDVLDAVHHRFDGVEKRLDGVEKRLDGVEKRLEEHDARFDDLAKNARALSVSVGDVWQLLGTMNRRSTERADNIEALMLKQREDFASLRAHVTSSVGILKDLIEARDFRLDDHGRRINALESPRLPET